MIDPYWTVEPDEPREVSESRPESGLVSLHFLRAAVRRTWPVWSLIACAGLLLGLAWPVVMPARSTGTVTLLLAHHPSSDPQQAMATDVSMLRTRAVASAVLDDLGLDMSPEGFQKSVTISPDTSTVLMLSLTAPSDPEAVERAGALAEVYLSFRADQLQAQAEAMIRGYRERVAGLQQRVDALTAEYTSLAELGPQAQVEAADVLNRRSQLDTEIRALQDTIQETALQTGAVIAASDVLDPAAVQPTSPTLKRVLTAVSGLVGGLAVGLGLVLFRAVTSDRLRRREEVALATMAPVRLSVGRIRGPRGRDRLALVSAGLEAALGHRGVRRSRLALAAVDNTREAAAAVAATATRLAARGAHVFTVDLSEAAVLDRAVGAAVAKDRDSGPTPVVYRPPELPLLRGPSHRGGAPDSPVPADDPLRAEWERSDVVLTLVDVDPGSVLDHLRVWTDEVVLLVTAGRSSAERLRTTSELVRAAGLELSSCVMVDADSTDESLGLVAEPEAGWAGGR